MKYIDEFRDAEILRDWGRKISLIKVSKSINLMEVCGTHTVSIHRFGLHKLLPENVKHISGPGCPVCVTPNRYIDEAIELSKMEDITIVTFGDMVRVPGSRSSLEKEKAEGADIKVVYSPLDSLKIAEETEKKVIFLAVGFETTAPTIAATVAEARKRNIRNFFILPGNKTMPNAMRSLLKDRDIKIDGFLLPGHVTTITGFREYEFIPRDFGVACAVSGFEPADIMLAFNSLINQIKTESPKVENVYQRSVKRDGNPYAKVYIERVFEPINSEWRGLGEIEHSGLGLKDEFKSFDIRNAVKIDIPDPFEHPGCRCGDVLKGKINPSDCPLFGDPCTPDNPIGPCMVSSEGSCSAYYKYG